MTQETLLRFLNQIYDDLSEAAKPKVEFSENMEKMKKEAEQITSSRVGSSKMTVLSILQAVKMGKIEAKE